MRISFTGTQSGMTAWQKEELYKRLVEFRCSELINGGCIGADEESISIAVDAGVNIFHFYPSYLKHKQAAVVKLGDTRGEYKLVPNGVALKIEGEESPLERNKKIVDASDLLIACPKEHVHTLRSGTWATIRYAWKRKKKVIVIPPIVREDDNGEKENSEEGSGDLPPAV